MKTAILILAAGSSTRMGEPKQLLPFKNTTLLGNTIEQAKNSKADSVFCVLGANEKAIKKSIEHFNIETIFNPEYKSGLSTSISIGINYLQNNYDAILIMLADQPKVNSNYLNELLTLSNKNPKKIITTSYKKEVGVPTIFPKNFYINLMELKGDSGAKKILQNNISNLITIKRITPFIDIDTKEQYKSFL